MGHLSNRMHWLLCDRTPILADCYQRYCCLARQRGTLRPFSAWLYLLRLNGRFYLRGKREPARLQLPAYQAIVPPEQLYLDRQSPQQLIQHLLSYDMVSFDLFDTLLLRPFLHPTDLFDVVGSRLHLPESFAALRIEAERQARRKDRLAGRSGEITLLEIYRQLQEETGLSAELGMRTEWETERDLCFSNPDLLEVYQAVLESGIPIYITSDMYLPSQLLKELLERNGFRGFRRILVSCEFGGGKYNGVLFRELRKDVGKGRLLHVGDRLDSDVQCARQNGLDALQVPPVHLPGAPAWPIYQMTRTIGSAYCGFADGALFGSFEKKSPLYGYGFVCGGILLLGYAGWLLEKGGESIRASRLLEQIEETLSAGTIGALQDQQWQDCCLTPEQQAQLPPDAWQFLLEPEAKRGILDAARGYLNRFAADSAWLRIPPTDAVAPLLAFWKTDVSEASMRLRGNLDKKLEKKQGISCNVPEDML